jgi:hypothetical protein
MRWDQLLFRWAPIVCVTCLLTATVQAGFTTINPPHPGEDSHQQIFDQIYGGTFSPFGSRGVDFSNGFIVAQRVDDVIGPDGEGVPLIMNRGPTGGDDDTDQLWRAAFTGAVAEAKFAAFDQNFGYFDGPSGGNYIQLFSLVGSGYAVQGEANISNLAGKTIRWGRGGQGRTLSSLIADNADDEDHMVTYQILEENPTDGGVAPLRWLVFWEDILRGEQFEDFDFNDLVVEITAIPEPAALSAVGFLALVLRRRA